MNINSFTDMGRKKTFLGVPKHYCQLRGPFFYHKTVRTYSRLSKGYAKRFDSLSTVLELFQTNMCTVYLRVLNFVLYMYLPLLY